MSVYFAYLLVCLSLTPIELVLSAILCKDSRIDAITYANDVQMYFFTSGGYYWWLKEKDFPPSDSMAKRLPSPFVAGHAAVYIDSDTGCANAMTAGVAKNEKEIWVEEYVGGEHKLMVFDTKKGVWRDQSIVYNEDKCISRARVDWASGKQLDAMFVRNYLEIYFVQDNNYAMVDCNFICTDPINRVGEDKPEYKTTDFHTTEHIFAMFVKRNKMLYMFHMKTYFELTILPSLRNGRLVTIKGRKEMNIVKDFFKITSPGQCIEQTTTQTVVGETKAPQIEDKPSGNKVDEEKPVVAPGKDNSESADEGKGGGKWSIVPYLLVAVIVIVVIVILVFIVVKRNSSTGKSDKEKAVSNKHQTTPSAEVNPKVQEVSPSAPKPTSKVGGTSRVEAKPQATSSLGTASTVTNKSNMGVVGIASKSSKN